MIDSFQQDRVFWKLVQELVIHHRYRILKFNENGEVWLELLERKERQLIRILRYDIDWANWLVHDIEKTNRAINELRKQPFRKKMKAYNIYISTYPPVDDWEHQINESDHLTEAILIQAGNQQGQLQKLFQQLSLPVPDSRSWLSFQEDSMVLMQEVLRIENERKQKEKSLLLGKKPVVTYILVAINVLFFILLETVGSSTDIVTLIQFGAKHNTAILAGEWWRFITPVFLHIGFLHLFMNTLALYYLGIAVERIYGAFRFLVIYFLAGIAGTIASFVFTTQISAGASGAIFGCFGALLYFGVVYPSLFFRTMGTNILVVVAINLAFGFLVPMVDNSAHIGGLIGGFLASAFVHLPNHKQVIRQLGSGVVLASVMVLSLLYGFVYSEQTEDPLIVGQLSQALIEKGEISHAHQLLIDYQQKEGEMTPELLFLLSYTEIKLGNITDAVSLLEQVVTLRSEFHEAHFNLSILYLEGGELEKAKGEIEKALELQPNNDDYKSLYEEIKNIK